MRAPQIKSFRYFKTVWFCFLALATGCSTRHASTKTASAIAPAKPLHGVESFEAAWRIIDETYFDPTFNGVDWKAVHDEFRPQAEAAATVKELRAVIQQMLDRLGQSHLTLIPREMAGAFVPDAAASNQMALPANPGPRATRKNPPEISGVAQANLETGSPENQNGDAGLEVRLIDNQLVVYSVEPGGPAALAGVKAGWVVQAIERQRADDLLKLLPDQPDRRRARVMGWSVASHKLKGPPNSKVAIEFLNEADQPVALVLERAPEPGTAAKLGYLPTFFSRLQSRRLPADSGTSVGLIHFNVWMLPIAPAFDRAIDELRDCAGIVLDLRGNVGGLAAMIMGLSGHFLNDRIALGVMKSRGSELRFNANPRRVSLTGQRVEPFAGPVAILVDEISLSASEIFAGGMQAIGRARVFGQPTLGAALPALFDRLPNGDVLMHAFGDFVTANGIRLEGKGVIPDDAAPLTRQDLLAGRDPALSAALRWIAGQH